MRKKGFALIEVIVSVVIMALVLTGFFAIFSAGKRYILSSSMRITAVELARYILEPLQMQVKQDEWTSNCVGNNINCPSGVQRFNDLPYDYNYTSNSQAGPISNLRKITVNITWSEPEFD